jgi:hypothetical protein
LQPYVLHSSKASSIDSYRTEKTATIINNNDDDENDIDTTLVMIMIVMIRGGTKVGARAPTRFTEK